VLKKVVPVWPRGTREHLTGDVVVEVVVDREGRVASAKAVYGHPLLYTATLDAVRKWRFRPYLLNGEPIDYQTRVSVQFRR
jgi:periplasmic protein TonB